MTKSVETDVALKGAEPLVRQHASEIQAYGHLVRMPIALSFIGADRDDAGRLDAVAGCEFLDDRVRLRE
jgi:hypothetical protein